jgi:hypothetical protein
LAALGLPWARKGIVALYTSGAELSDDAIHDT